MDTSVLVIYTGGTIGMKQNSKTGALVPFDFSEIEKEVPELKKFKYKLDTHSFRNPIDSSDVKPEFWATIAKIIKNSYDLYDGFVILHGTDTMSYSASALSFMLENLSKPVIFTGSQLPIDSIRTDGKENILSAIEIAASRQNGKPVIPEVCIFFDYKLFRGNRTTKHSAEKFNAFRSYNYPALAEAGVEIKYNLPAIAKPESGKILKIHTEMDTSVIGLKIFPGINCDFIDNILNTKGLKGIIIETFGSGNTPTSEKFLSKFKTAIDKGLIALNISQCQAGSVEMERYETGILFKNTGVVCGKDMTFEAAITKLSFLLTNNKTVTGIKEDLQKSLRGEIS
ncbi:MAG: type I asparaginase [Prevotellaceae bacterium]|jgi:L-asparaginase|nr:type I asparaginase [Prevotellaceae bacterium]